MFVLTSGHRSLVQALALAVHTLVSHPEQLAELTRNDIRAADFLVMAGGGWVVDQTDPAGPVVLREERLAGEVLAELLTTLEEKVGPLTVMVEALDAPGAPLWGDHDPSWPYQDAFEARNRRDCLANDVIKAFVRTADHDVDVLLLDWVLPGLEGPAVVRALASIHR